MSGRNKWRERKRGNAVLNKHKREKDREKDREKGRDATPLFVSWQQTSKKDF